MILSPVLVERRETRWRPLPARCRGGGSRRSCPAGNRAARPPRRGGSCSSSGRDRASSRYRGPGVRPRSAMGKRVLVPSALALRCGCGYGTVVWRRRLSPPALALRCRHALASRASGGSRPWSRRGFDARAMGWHAVSGGRAAPIIRGIVPYRLRAPVAAPHHGMDSRTRAAQDGGMRGYRQ